MEWELLECMSEIDSESKSNLKIKSIMKTGGLPAIASDK